MIKPPAILIISALLLLSGCGVKDKTADMKNPGFRGSSDTKVEGDGNTRELTGMLQVVDAAKCPLAEGCGPRFSLLGSDLKSQIEVEGDIKPEHERLILSVVGEPGPLADDRVGTSGYERINTTIKISQYRLRSSIPYYPFLVEKAAEFSAQNFGCEVLWDKTYSWTIEQDIPLLSVKMTDTFAAAPQPWIELTYNGSSGEFVDSETSSDNITPCAYDVNSSQAD